MPRILGRGFPIAPHILPGGRTKYAALQDNWAVNDLSTLWSTSIGTVVYSSGQVSIQVDSSYSSALNTPNLYGLTESYFYLKIAPYQNTSVQTSVNFGVAANG